MRWCVVHATLFVEVWVCIVDLMLTNGAVDIRLHGFSEYSIEWIVCCYVCCWFDEKKLKWSQRDKLLQLIFINGWIFDENIFWRKCEQNSKIQLQFYLIAGGTIIISFLVTILVPIPFTAIFNFNLNAYIFCFHLIF